ncbi:hypothetical protein THFILI_04745 [Thermus filiformis]|uniref:site-specific DNA-methyltransferase (adenine-specific) n=1 Tax=Thermus filiformis TaxID=276 RepID=A0A0A2WX15_THEFI|nr:hypothetical protein THFILI_04745 [Thermus filiformis]
MRVEGGLFAQDFLERLGRGEVPGQRPQDFGLKGSLAEAIAQAYEDAKAYWVLFQRRLERLGEGESKTSLTREGWAMPFLGLLGYSLTWQGYVEAGGRRWPISHRAGPEPGAPPVLVVSYESDLSRADPGLGRRSPHGLMQDYLNASEHLWGLVTNGRVLRLLRQTPFARRQAYLEVDLQALMEGDAQAEFALLFRLLHRTRLPKTPAEARESLLEQYYQEALSQGERAREKLRDGVEAFLKQVGTGFLRGPGGEKLAKNPQTFYEDLLRLAYRLLFLLVAEARGVLAGNEVYREGYGLERLARLVDDPEAYTEDRDLWLGLKALFHLLRDAHPVPELGDRPLASALGLHVLNGRLFEPLALEEEPYAVDNRHLLLGFRHLVYYHDREAGGLQRVNYAALDVEELGSVYESLLDHRPVVLPGAEGPEFAFAGGTERKQTGSYYTPHELVELVLKEALDPVVEERLRGAASQEERERALLSLKVVDPAAGSGHFLLGAARRLGKRLAQVRTGEEEPDPQALRKAVREVVAHCLYAVDKNPLAAELCRVGLWMESQLQGKPLGFLDHRVRHGDSLVGTFSYEDLLRGIPDEAFEPKEGDDKGVARAVKKQNQRERGGDRYLFGGFGEEDFRKALEAFRREMEEIARLSEDTPEGVAEKARRYEALKKSDMWQKMRLAADLWTAAFFQPLRGEGPFITTGAVWDALEGRVDPRLEALATDLAQKVGFFHWWLEFPEVFAQGWFDVVLGNPPWEVVQAGEEEFFAQKDPEIAQASGARRKRLIQELPQRNPRLYEEWLEYVRDLRGFNAFVRESGRFPLSARGKINLYPLFSELARTLTRQGGRAGVVVPTGIATDDTNKFFFAEVAGRGELAALYDFENRQKLFPAVDSRMKFCVLALRKPEGSASEPARFAFFCHSVDDLSDPERLFSLTPEDFRLLNPNTRTAPVFRTRRDAELTKYVYRRVPVLVDEGRGEAGNPWGVEFMQGLFNMTSASHLFHTLQDLEAQGLRLEGNAFVGKDERYLPLYEAKLIHQFDHRWATYAGSDTRDVTEAEKADPRFLVLPRYWVAEKEVEGRLERRDRTVKVVWRWDRGWNMGWRDIARSTDERTFIASVYPRVGAGDTFLQMFPSAPTPLVSVLLANLNALPFDYTVRQKIGGTHLKYHVTKQLPVLPPSAYGPEHLRFVVPRVLELVYTAWDLAPFAQDVWNEAEGPLREAILAQLSGNGGHRDEPPPWLKAPYPFPPFRYDPGRRARLRAELDALYFLLYLGTPEAWAREAPPELRKLFPTPKEAIDYVLDQFPITRRKEEERHGEYRTKRWVLEAWERLLEAGFGEG